MILDLGYYLLGLSGALFYALYDTLQPSTPTLSQIPDPVATTSTRIRLISWNQPKIPVPLHQLFEYCFCSFLHKSIFGYWYFGLETKKGSQRRAFFNVLLQPSTYLTAFSSILSIASWVIFFNAFGGK